MLKLLSILILFVSKLVVSYSTIPVSISKGEVWPKPRSIYYYEPLSISSIKPSEFKFKVQGESCVLLEKAIKRYSNMISVSTQIEKMLVEPKNENNYLGISNELIINLGDKCNEFEYPSLEMDESYKLRLKPNEWILTASSIWGILRGLETFSQLIYFDNNSLLIKSVLIVDSPRYKHRGILFDTSRHFLPMKIILDNLDAMAYNKLNVFHWHIVDDQSFPYESKTFPELSDLGSFHPSLIYTQEDVKTVIEYARERGIRVIPEFDTPGHTYSWGKGIKKLLTSDDTDMSSNINPVDESSYVFLNQLFNEIIEVFPDQYLHLGGDEVDLVLWRNYANVSNFMDKLRMGCAESMQNYYTMRLFSLFSSLKDKVNFIVWEEVFFGGAHIPNNTIIHIWRKQDSLIKAIQSGMKVIYSECWYLDQINSNWLDYYQCEPAKLINHSSLLYGGEACMWGEKVNEYNILQRTWPRASAVAEKLWSKYNRHMDNVAERLGEHTCRMNRRGIPAEPANGPGYCLDYTQISFYKKQTSTVRTLKSQSIQNLQDRFSLCARGSFNIEYEQKRMNSYSNAVHLYNNKYLYILLLPVIFVIFK